MCNETKYDKKKENRKKKKGSKLNDGIVARKCKVGRGSRKHSSLDLNKKSHGNEVLNAEKTVTYFLKVLLDVRWLK